jgi:hypothetical protein
LDGSGICTGDLLKKSFICEHPHGKNAIAINKIHAPAARKAMLPAPASLAPKIHLVNVLPPDTFDLTGKLPEYCRRHQADQHQKQFPGNPFFFKKKDYSLFFSYSGLTL